MPPHTVRRGFSLLEMVVVIALIAIMGSGVALVYRDSLSNTQMVLTLDRLKVLDERARIRCIRKDGGHKLIFSTEQQCIFTTPSNGRGRPKVLLKFPRRIELKDVRTSVGSGQGKTEIPYYRDGTSPTWYVVLKNGASEKNIFFSGRSGQALVNVSESFVEGAFNEIR